MSKEKVYETLKNSDVPLKSTQVAELSGLDKAVVDKAIKDLKKEEKIQSPKMCFYEVKK